MLFEMGGARRKSRHGIGATFLERGSSRTVLSFFENGLAEAYKNRE
jgi:hypothetical protein